MINKNILKVVFLGSFLICASTQLSASDYTSSSESYSEREERNKKRRKKNNLRAFIGVAGCCTALIAGFLIMRHRSNASKASSVQTPVPLIPVPAKSFTTVVPSQCWDLVTAHCKGDDPSLTLLNVTKLQDVAACCQAVINFLQRELETARDKQEPFRELAERLIARASCRLEYRDGSGQGVLFYFKEFRDNAGPIEKDVQDLISVLSGLQEAMAAHRPPSYGLDMRSDLVKKEDVAVVADLLSVAEAIKTRLGKLFLILEAEVEQTANLPEVDALPTRFPEPKLTAQEIVPRLKAEALQVLQLIESYK